MLSKYYKLFQLNTYCDIILFNILKCINIFLVYGYGFTENSLKKTINLSMDFFRPSKKMTYDDEF